jgi:transposase
MLGAPEWSGVAPRMRSLLQDMRAEWQGLDRRIETFDEEFAVRARTDTDARQLRRFPGIGVLNATALVAVIGNGRVVSRQVLAEILSLIARLRAPPALVDKI